MKGEHMDAKNIIKGERKGISNWFRRFVTYIDPGKGMYKIQESLLGIIKWGKYSPLPKIDYVLVFKQLFAKCETCSIDEYENNDFSYYQVSIVHHKTHRIIVHETNDKQEAMNMGRQIALTLQTRLKDSASVRGQSTWIF